MKRRAFITLLGGSAAGWPLAARAQQPTVPPTIGFIGSDSPDLHTERLRAVRLGLKSTGFVEGQNLAIEYRWAEGRNDKLPILAADLVRRQVAVIIAPTTPSVLAAKAASETIPIVFFVAGDPIDLGLVGSLGRPGSYLTGATTLTLRLRRSGCSCCMRWFPRRNRWLCLLIRQVQISLQCNRETYRRRRAAVVWSFMCSRPALTRISRLPSRAWPNYKPVDS